MSEVLKGNFQVKKSVDVEVGDDLSTQFEREALKRLGGSIAFVSKKKFSFGLEPADSLLDEPKDKHSV